MNFKCVTDRSIWESTNILVASTASEMVQKDSQVESLTFSGMDGKYSANHATKALHSLFPFSLGFIPYEIFWKIYVRDTPCEENLWLARNHSVNVECFSVFMTFSRSV